MSFAALSAQLGRVALGMRAVVVEAEKVIQKTTAVDTAMRRVQSTAREVSAANSRYTAEQEALLKKLAESVYGWGGYGVVVDKAGNPTGERIQVGGASGGESLAKKLDELLQARDKYSYDSSLSGIRRLDAVNQALKNLEKWIQLAIDPYFRIDRFYAKPKSGKTLTERVDGVEQTVVKGRASSGLGSFKRGRSGGGVL